MIHRYRPGMTGLNKCLVAVGLSLWALVSLGAPPRTSRFSLCLQPNLRRLRPIRSRGGRDLP